MFFYKFFEPTKLRDFSAGTEVRKKTRRNLDIPLPSNPGQVVLIATNFETGGNGRMRINMPGKDNGKIEIRMGGRGQIQINKKDVQEFSESEERFQVSKNATVSTGISFNMGGHGYRMELHKSSEGKFFYVMKEVSLLEVTQRAGVSRTSAVLFSGERSPVVGTGRSGRVPSTRLGGSTRDMATASQKNQKLFGGKR